MSRYGWRPYVPVGVRRARALMKIEKLREKGIDVKPVEIEGRKIARTFWGEAWCDHLESFSDYENRLPRGRTYVRNNSVCHLEIDTGEVEALVAGSDLYTVNVSIKTLPGNKWKVLKKRCAGQIGSLLELLKGRLSSNVMSIVTDRKKGLFPSPAEISLDCSCPDWAVMCKHVAAVLYGVGARLDEEPELLFLLRGVDHEELISTEVSAVTATVGTKGGSRRISDDALSDVFGIEMTEDVSHAGTKSSPRRKKAASKSKKTPGVGGKPAAKRKARKGKSKTRNRKTPASRKDGSKDSSRPTRSARRVTGKAVAGLRAKFGMSQNEFGRLLGVSTPTIGNWERKPGALNLQTRSLDAWNVAKRLTKRQARRKLDGS